MFKTEDCIRLLLLALLSLMPSMGRAAEPARGVGADARSFLETGLPIFTNDNAARRHYWLPSLLVSSTGTVIAVSQLRRGAG